MNESSTLKLILPHVRATSPSFRSRLPPSMISFLKASIPSIVSKKNADEVVVYGGHELRMNEHWGIKYGLRIGGWTNRGEAFEFVFDENGTPTDTLNFEKGEKYNTYNFLVPRLTISYNFNENSAIKTNYSRTVQNINLISN